MRKVPYPCTGCGLCCRHVRGYMMEREDGSCIHLFQGRCEIYESRPKRCRVDEMIEAHENAEARYRENVAACNRLQEMYGMEVSYRLPLIFDSEHDENADGKDT